MIEESNIISKPNQAKKYKPLKYNKLWLYAGYFWVGITVYVCLIPNPPSTSGIEFGDKFVHMAGYICLFVWFSQIYNRQNHWRPAVGLILMGILIEFAQGLTAYRSFELADMLANTAGVLVGWLIAGSFVSFIFVKLEAMMFKEQKA